MSSKIQIKKLSKKELEKLEVFTWPIWEKEESQFDWFYDEQEQCYFLEGDVIVNTKDGEYHIKAGDFVIFPKNLHCTWTIKKKVRKHYNFG